MEYTRVNNDINGNPRYVFHFFSFLKVDEPGYKNFELALSRAKTIGGKKYRGNDFGGGIVFQSYNIEDTIEKIKALTND